MTRLLADGITAVDVPAKLSARVRLLSQGHNRKSDQADRRVGGGRRGDRADAAQAEIDQTSATLRVLTEHRDDLVRTRTQTIDRLHVLLTQLVLAGASRHLAADVVYRTLLHDAETQPTITH